MWHADLFGERERPPLSPEVFATLVALRLDRLGFVRLESQRGLELRLAANGRVRRLSLEEYYDRFRADPALLEQVIREAIESVRPGQDKAQEDDPFGDIAPLLRPLLMTAGGWEEQRGLGLDPLVRPLVSDLGIGLVVNRPDELQYVETRALDRWGIGITAAYDTAARNLQQTLARVATIQHGSGAETLLVDRDPDGYAATRVTLPSRLQDWSRRVQGQLVVGLPTRNLMLGFSRDHPAMAEIASQVARDAAGLADGLYPRLLANRDGKLVHLSESGS